jgi:hypothetical protein
VYEPFDSTCPRWEGETPAHVGVPIEKLKTRWREYTHESPPRML